MSFVTRDWTLSPRSSLTQGNILQMICTNRERERERERESEAFLQQKLRSKLFSRDYREIFSFIWVCEFEIILMTELFPDHDQPCRSTLPAVFTSEEARLSTLSIVIIGIVSACVWCIFQTEYNQSQEI